MQTVPKATFWALFTDSWAFLSITLPKIAVALLLIRLFRPRKWIKNTLLGASIGLFIICVVGFIICFVQCNPVAGQWDPYTHPDVVCWPRDVQIIYALFGSCESIQAPCRTELTANSFFHRTGCLVCCISSRRDHAVENERWKENNVDYTYGTRSRVSAHGTGFLRDDRS